MLTLSGQDYNDQYYFYFSLTHQLLDFKKTKGPFLTVVYLQDLEMIFLVEMILAHFLNHTSQRNVLIYVGSVHSCREKNELRNDPWGESKFNQGSTYIKISRAIFFIGCLLAYYEPSHLPIDVDKSCLI